MNRNLGQRTGFTLIETLLALMIGSLTVFLVLLTVNQIRVQRTSQLMAEMQLDNAVQHLSGGADPTSYLDGDSEQIRIKAHSSTAKPVVQKIVLRNSQLLMTTGLGGYMPLVEHVRSVHFSHQNEQLEIVLTLLDRRKFSRIIFMPQLNEELVK